MPYFSPADPILIWATVIGFAAFCTYVIKCEMQSGSVFTFSNFVIVKAYMIPVAFVGLVAVSDKQGIGYKHIYAVRENIGWASVLALISLVFLFSGYVYAQANEYKSKFPRMIHGIGKKILRIDYLVILCGVATMLLGFALATGAQFGAFRSHGLENRALLPIFAALNSVGSFGLAVAIASIHQDCTIQQKRIRFFLALYLGFICMGVGTRSALLDPLIVGLAAYFQSRKRSGVVAIVMIAPLLVIFGIVVSGVRGGEGGVEISLIDIQYAFLYGSNFPDFRNLAMILGALEPPSETAYFGKTIISSVISFIPSGIVPWRAEYAWGNIVPSALNFNAQHHPGVRGLPFTEWYFNFGLLGLIVSSCVFGFVLRLVSFSRIYAGRDRAYYIIGGFFVYKFVGYFFTTTPNLASFYPVLFLFLFTLLLRKLSNAVSGVPAYS